MTYSLTTPQHPVHPVQYSLHLLYTNPIHGISIHEYTSSENNFGQDQSLGQDLQGIQDDLVTDYPSTSC